MTLSTKKLLNLYLLTTCGKQKESLLMYTEIFGPYIHRAIVSASDEATGEIKDIPALHFNKATKHFTLKNLDKRISTVKSLPPKKVRGTAKNIKETLSSGSSSDSEKE